MAAWARLLLLQAGDGQLCSPFGHRLYGVVKGGESRAEIASQQNVIKPDNRQILGESSPAFSQVRHHACCHYIVEGEHRSDFRTLNQQVRSGQLASLLGKGLADNPAWFDLQMILRHSLLVSLQTQLPIGRSQVMKPI